MNEHNPWDQTIWDPAHPEQAIEDPLHGPSAVNDLWQTPAMPRGDGTYYQPGAFYTHGTAYLDSRDRPVFRVGLVSLAGMREMVELQEWLDANGQGEEALVALEASRQLKRLEETGIARCYKSSDVCPGGKRLENCETGSAAYAAVQDWATKNNEEKSGEGTIVTTLAWAGGKCVGCAVSCEAAVKTVDGKPDENRVTFYRPDPTIPTVHIPTDSVQIFRS